MRLRSTFLAARIPRLSRRAHFCPGTGQLLLSRAWGVEVCDAGHGGFVMKESHLSLELRSLALPRAFNNVGLKAGLRLRASEVPPPLCELVLKEGLPVTCARYYSYLKAIIGSTRIARRAGT